MFGHHSDPDLMLLKDFLFSLTGQYPTSILFEDREINTVNLETKDIRLDLRVLLDGNVYSNIEKGKFYSEMIPVRQIFILNYILFPNKSKGVHTFMMNDVDNHTPLD